MAEQWRNASYPSGTQVVTSDRVGEPWLYVFGPSHERESDRFEGRYRMCCELADFMNGGERPAWLDDGVRSGEGRVDFIDGAKIIATGPYYDANPPSLDWKEDRSPEARDKRARLIDVVMGIRDRKAAQ